MLINNSLITIATSLAMEEISRGLKRTAVHQICPQLKRSNFKRKKSKTRFVPPLKTPTSSQTEHDILKELETTAYTNPTQTSSADTESTNIYNTEDVKAMNSIPFQIVTNETVEGNNHSRATTNNGSITISSPDCSSVLEVQEHCMSHLNDSLNEVPLERHNDMEEFGKGAKNRDENEECSTPKRTFKVPKVHSKLPIMYNYTVGNQRSNEQKAMQRQVIGKGKKQKISCPTHNSDPDCALDIFDFPISQTLEPNKQSSNEGYTSTVNESSSMNGSIRLNRSINNKTVEQQLAVDQEVLEVISETRAEIQAMKEKYAIFFADMTASGSGWAELAETLMKDSRNQRSKEKIKESEQDISLFISGKEE